MALSPSSEKKGGWGWPDMMYIGMILISLLGFAYVLQR